MPTKITSLEKKINSCMIRDRFELRKKLKGLRSSDARKGVGQSADKKSLISLQRAQNLVDRSMAKVEKRRRLLAEPKFPANLPITDRVADIEEAIRKNQVVILAGETGSGKTTQIPKICLGLGRGVVGKIGHTQPRRVAARTVANRVAEELGVKLGQEVGYQVRFTDQVSDNTLIKIMTDGILLAETQYDRYLEDYDTLIIDEAHERSLNIDFLLGYLNRLLPKRRDLKVIITSATIDVDRFSRSFNNAPIIEVSGRTYPVDLLYRPLPGVGGKEAGRDTEELMQQGILDALKEIQSLERLNKGDSDVLVFLSGEREIREVSQILRKARLKDTEILPLYARLSVVEQNKVFEKHRSRRVVLATNVAETSLTVPGIRYVIDPGLARISRYSYRSKVQRLHIEPISQASAEQRKGRCGRLSDGVCIRLYSEEDFQSRPEFTDPEVLRTNLGAVILTMLTLNLGDIDRFPFIEKPDARRINDGFHLLSELQAVDERKRVTRLGRSISKLPVDLRLARMLIAADREGSLKEVLVIASALATQDPRERPHDHQQAADDKHRSFLDDNSDFLALLNLWNFFEEKRQQMSQNKLRKFCRENYLSFLRMREWREIHRQLHLVCGELKLSMNRREADYGAVHKALLAGILGNLGEKHSENEYLGARNKKFFIFPGSSQFKKRPRWLVAAELVETTRLYARNVAQIESEWLEPLADHLVTRSYSDPHWEKRAGQVVAYEQVALYGVAIVKRRKVNFGPIDPVPARQIFIQSALVDGQLNTKAGFYHHNNHLIEEINLLEMKTRRRDILIDSEVLFQFYDGLIPAPVYDVNSLESWRSEVENDDERILYLDKEQLMKRDALIPDDQYPAQFTWQSVTLDLDYQFDPQHDDDGVSVNVPVSILGQVPSAQIEWLIPGLLREKCIALVKSLPKSIRRNFAPAPQFVDQALPQMSYDGRPLREVLGERLQRLTGVRIPMDAWQTERLSNYLRMNIRVRDDQGKAIGSGRDLVELVQRFSADSERSFKSRPKHAVERKELVRWDFDELPEYVEIDSAGVTVRGYPAMIDCGKSVAIEIGDDVESARQLTERGVLRLIMLELGQQVKYVSRNIPEFSRFSLYYSTLGSSEELLQEMIEAIFRFTFVESQTIPRNREDFEECLGRRQNLVTVTNDVSRLVGTVLTEHNKLRARLGDFDSNSFAEAVQEIESHLNGLIHRGFLQQISYHWLGQCPRYIQADSARLEKLQGSLKRDQENRREFEKYWHRYEQRREELAGKNDPDLKTYRWMIEEYRVSLFAQSLGTSIPISPKRLEKQWLKVVG
ncbi:MAG: ATP-dependent RNA helicase HrpA [Pseudomonadales bacterium]|nr:ATP-dependent RNA helicase HrpA [Pseudomonadales bacterium]HJN52474.1 ATP-dependent RNA helicase HrpA [Pseudomonadales bacterium]